jgi:thioredoxin 1
MKAWMILGGAIMLMIGCKPGDAPEAVAAGVTETRHLSAAEFDEFIKTPGKLVVVMFHADWCGPCRQQGPNVEAVIEEFGGKAIFGMIDVDDHGELANRHGVTGIPDLRVFRNGIMVDAMKGAIPKEQIRNHFSIQVAQLSESVVPSGETVGSEAAIQPMKEQWLPPGMEPRR